MEVASSNLAAPTSFLFVSSSLLSSSARFFIPHDFSFRTIFHSARFPSACTILPLHLLPPWERPPAPELGSDRFFTRPFLSLGVSCWTSPVGRLLLVITGEIARGGVDGLRGGHGKGGSDDLGVRDGKMSRLPLELDSPGHHSPALLQDSTQTKRASISARHFMRDTSCATLHEVEAGRRREME